MEQLLVRADDLHREAALLSNTLHEYRDDEVDGVRPVIQQILSKREAWRKVRAKIEYFEKTGSLPEDTAIDAPVAIGVPMAANAANSGAISDLKVELARLNTNISKARKKLELTPAHKKAPQWQEDLARMEAVKTDLKNQITNLTYATT